MTSQNIKHAAASILVLAIFAGAAAGQNAGKAIPQPVVEGLKLAPDSARVDLNLPKFSNPTKITNPLFPITKQESVLLAGKVNGKAFRTEVTLLPYTRIIQWEGVEIEAAVSQYVAFLDGRIEEVAIDLYAQADDGSVWYLGEDVSDFKICRIDPLANIKRRVGFSNQSLWPKCASEYKAQSLCDLISHEAQPGSSCELPTA